jgi:flagellar hook assembly protein FlgD
VETESRLSRLLPYPNPFSTATRFQYTLTGDAPPSDFILQIMTISGEIVREVDELEFGPMRVGTHLSEFVWDGTDQFGDKLANGVYLYRVLTRDQEGNPFQPYSNPAIDRYFKNGIGKVVILR